MNDAIFAADDDDDDDDVDLILIFFIFTFNMFEFGNILLLMLLIVNFIYSIKNETVIDELQDQMDEFYKLHLTMFGMDKQGKLFNY